jgi:hypothetical protein
LSRPIELTPEQFAGLRGGFADLLRGVTGQVGTGGLPQFQGPLAAPITGAESGLLGQLLGQTGPGTARSDLLSRTLSGEFLAGNPHLEQYIRAAQGETLRGLEESLSRTLPGRFTLGGQSVQPRSSSAFDYAAAKATGETAQALGDIATKIAFPAYEAERTRQQEAVKLDQAEVDTTIKNLQAQALPRLIQEQGIERGTALFTENVRQLLQALQIIAGVTAPTIGQVSSGVSAGGSQATQQASAFSNQYQTSQAEGESTPGIFSALFPKGF